MNKFKIGDKVKIKNNVQGTRSLKTRAGIIISISPGYYNPITVLIHNSNFEYCFSADELLLIKKPKYLL